MSSNILFDYPQSAAYGRVLPKSKIYAYARASAAVKALFVREVEQIVWQYKLAPETVNLKATRSVPEIQVFRIVLKTGTLKHDVLRCIDQAIPFPILFELVYEGKTRAIAAYKRSSDSDATKWVVSAYFESEWLSGETPRTPLPVAFDLEKLYSNLLMPLLPFQARPGERIQACVTRMEMILAKQREMEKCETKLRKEKQFNRKVTLNATLREIKQELETLTRHEAIAQS